MAVSIWFFVSPWVLQFGFAVPAAAPGAPAPAAPAAPVYGAVSDAAWNAWVLAVIIFLVCLSAMGGRWSLWQDKLNALLAIWVFVAPWLLGFAGLPAAAWDHWIVGVVIFLCAISIAFGGRRDLPAATL